MVMTINATLDLTEIKERYDIIITPILEEAVFTINMKNVSQGQMSEVTNVNWTHKLFTLKEVLFEIGTTYLSSMVDYDISDCRVVSEADKLEGFLDATVESIATYIDEDLLENCHVADETYINILQPLSVKILNVFVGIYRQMLQLMVVIITGAYTQSGGQYQNAMRNLAYFELYMSKRLGCQYLVECVFNDAYRPTGNYGRI